MATYLLALLVALVLISLAFGVTRRLWVFFLTSVRYGMLWLANAIGIRWLWAKITGKPYVHLTRPALARLFCEDMGPTFVKFGQIVASSSGLFPEAYVKEFQKVLDRVKPIPYSLVTATIKEELGEKASQIANIDPTPLASASIAQVHTATLADGQDVVIKVQRPGIAKQTAADMKILRMVASWGERMRRSTELANPVGIVEDFTATLREELSFRKEAENLNQFNAIMAQHGHINIRAPKPIADLVTDRVLVMERFRGIRVDQFDVIRARGLDGETQLVRGLRAWIQCVVFHGFFHGDVHAGNLMILDNEDLGFLDFGIVGRYGEKQKWLISEYMVSFSMGNYRRVAEIVLELVDRRPPDLQMELLVEDLARVYAPMRDTAFGKLNYAEVIPQIQAAVTKHKIRLPRELILITKQFLYFDRYAKGLAPNLNVFTDPRLIVSLMADLQKARMEYEAKKAAASVAA